MRGHLRSIPLRLARLFDELGSRGAVRNAREASTELSRRRVERQEVDELLRQLGQAPQHGTGS